MESILKKDYEVIRSYNFNLNYTALGKRDFADNFISIIPELFTFIDSYPYRTLVFSKDSKLFHLFYNFCLFDEIKGKVLRYPQATLFYLSRSLLDLGIYNLKFMEKLQKDFIKVINYPHTIIEDINNIMMLGDSEMALYDQNTNKVVKINFTDLHFYY